MQLIFDGGGKKWIEEFSKEHKMTPLSQSLKSSGVFAGVCDYCETSFGGEKDLLKKVSCLCLMNIKDIQALPDSLQMVIKLLHFEKNDYVLVINPFVENTNLIKVFFVNGYCVY